MYRRKEHSKKKKFFLRFHHKLFISYLIIIIFTFIAFLSINFYRSSLTAEENSVYSAGQTVTQTMEYMEYMLKSVDSTMLQLVLNERIQEIFKRDTSLYAQDKLQQIKDQLELSDILFAATSYPISNIRLYIPSKIGLSEENVNFSGLDSALESPWYERIKDTRKSVWLPSDYFVNSHISKEIISLVKKIPSNENYNITLGIIQIEVSKEVFRELVNRVKFTKNSSVVLFNKYGEIICESEKIGQAISLDYSLINSFFPDENYDALTWKRAELLGEDYLIGIQSVKAADWNLVLAIPWREIMEPYIKSRNNMIFVVLLLVIPLSLLLSYLFSRTNTKRIRLLISHMRKVVNGNFNVEILPIGNDEIGELFQNYNYMITKISILMEEKYKLGQQMKNLELKSLQAQINPHFLYNTLDLINWMAVDVNALNISKLVKTLSRFYRITLSSGKEIVPLKDEIEHITSYVNIQNMRFDDGIRLETDISPEYYSCAIIKLTLQPIIENSILHGILEKEDPTGTIRVTASDENEDIVITVADDGVGIPPDKLKTILENPVSGKTSGFGIKNINERIQLTFGKKYGLEYESIPNKGTTVKIRIPNIDIRNYET